MAGFFSCSPHFLGAGEGGFHTSITANETKRMCNTAKTKKQDSEVNESARLLRMPQHRGHIKEHLEATRTLTADIYRDHDAHSYSEEICASLHCIRSWSNELYALGEPEGTTCSTVTDTFLMKSNPDRNPESVAPNLLDPYLYTTPNGKEPHSSRQ